MKMLFKNKNWNFKKINKKRYLKQNAFYKKKVYSWEKVSKIRFGAWEFGDLLLSFLMAILLKIY